ncbi:hypothetical protein [Flavobacterium sp.]|uniref:hypothetical protein n=1 Tax=Flavobacterium sp. TaxID=239 RepID=UPI0025C0D903|nr:hypothetical protein [Flavobacterium sp.]
MFSIFSRPFIASYEENQNALILNIHVKSKKCGFINISQEHVIFQFYYGWTNVGKGALKIENVSFKYVNNELIIFKVVNDQKIAAFNCNRFIYEKAFEFLQVKQRERGSSKFRSNLDEFLKQ